MKGWRENLCCLKNQMQMTRWSDGRDTVRYRKMEICCLIDSQVTSLDWILKIPPESAAFWRFRSIGPHTPVATPSEHAHGYARDVWHREGANSAVSYQGNAWQGDRSKRPVMMPRPQKTASNPVSNNCPSGVLPASGKPRPSLGIVPTML